MTFIKRTIIFSLILFFLHDHSFSQEKLIVPDINTSIRQLYEDESRQLKSALNETDTLLLPFFDDFTNLNSYPRNSLWEDRNVYINQGYAHDPLSIGVATFDCYDEKGEIYSHAISDPFPSDILTSRAINLEGEENNSVFLSFFYQSQGNSDEPEDDDSLVVHFYSPVNKTWRSVFRIKGRSRTPFKNVIIPITDPDYFHKGFKFRFINHASVNYSSEEPDLIVNSDQWNIDYVYLNRHRSYTDTIFEDVAFYRPPKNLLNHYSSIPLKHLNTASSNEIEDNISIFYRNLGDSARTITTRRFVISDYLNDTIIHEFSGGIGKIDERSSVTFSGSIENVFQSKNQQKAIFKITSFISTDTTTLNPLRAELRNNDTTFYLQEFDDYYAYDDGTAELGYGVYGQGSQNARIAYQFYTYQPDTLKGIYIHFEKAKDNPLKTTTFRLAIWGNRNGRPGNLLFADSIGTHYPGYHNNINGFDFYLYDTSILVIDTFYVGLIQTKANNLNIGFDVNSIHNDKIFFNRSGEWKNSTFPGSLMIRPVMGKRIIAGIQTKKAGSSFSFNIYPNPARDIIHVSSTGNPGEFYYTLYNYNGMQILNGQFHSNTAIDISDLADGMYLMILKNNSGAYQSKPFVVIH
ncbi:T9SS type A sorting domain-containing protein [Bacteroidota bacterium]